MGKTRAECSQNAYTSHASAFLSHWIKILANSSPKSDIKKKKKKKTRPWFFAFYGRSGEGNITIFFFWPKGLRAPDVRCVHAIFCAPSIWKSWIRPWRGPIYNKTLLQEGGFLGPSSLYSFVFLPLNRVAQKKKWNTSHNMWMQLLTPVDGYLLLRKMIPRSAIWVY